MLEIWLPAFNLYHIGSVQKAAGCLGWGGIFGVKAGALMQKSNINQEHANLDAVAQLRNERARFALALSAIVNSQSLIYFNVTPPLLDIFNAIHFSTRAVPR